MLTIRPQLIQTLTVFDVFDPDELGRDSRVSERFPAWNNKHRYMLRNRPACVERPHGLLTRFGVRPFGDMLLGYITDRFGTEVKIVDEGIDRFCVSTMLAGHMAIRTPSGRAEESSSETGLIYRGDAGNRFSTSDANARLTVWIDAYRVESMLRSLLGRELGRKLEFDLAVDWTNPGAASLQALIGHLTSELERADGLVSNKLALATATDLFAQALLLGLPHNYTSQLQDERHSPAPRAVRRAEEYLRGHADQPLRMEQVAAAAGCSLRALQLAFQRFRGTTPRAVLHGIRLDSARDEILRSDAPITDIAQRWAFTSNARFASAYAKRFGERPTETRR